MHKSLLLIALACAVSACNMEVRSYRAEGVPAMLLGQWQGSWSSSSNSATGTISVRVQEFEGAPVVGVVLDNPCIVPQVYELLLRGNSIELAAGGATVLSAEIGPGNELVGVYSCAADFGTWSAQRSGELPQILDLAGEWAGTVFGAGGVADDIRIDLAQHAEGGTVVLEGTLEFSTLLPLPVPVIGHAFFRSDGYDVVLGSSAGLPVIQLIGAGESGTMSIDQGVILVSGGGLIPFASGVWTATQTPR